MKKKKTGEADSLAADLGRIAEAVRSADPTSQDAIVSLGADLEKVSGPLAKASAEATPLLGSVLEALQAVYQQNCPDPTATLEAVAGVLDAIRAHAAGAASQSDLTEAAARLFDHLHRLDARGSAVIAVSPIPETGLGRAINDRLRRAAAPRPRLHP